MSECDEFPRSRKMSSGQKANAAMSCREQQRAVRSISLEQ